MELLLLGLLVGGMQILSKGFLIEKTGLSTGNLCEPVARKAQGLAPATKREVPRAAGKVYDETVSIQDLIDDSE